LQSLYIGVATMFWYVAIGRIHDAIVCLFMLQSQ
jgi:hypothetical protein